MQTIFYINTFIYEMYSIREEKVLESYVKMNMGSMKTIPLECSLKDKGLIKAELSIVWFMTYTNGLIGFQTIGFA